MFPPVGVTSQTTHVLVCEDGATSLSVTASGPASNYQWQVGTLTNGFNNVPAQYPYSGVNNAQLDIISTPDTLNGLSFRCIISGPCGNTISQPIPVDVIQGPYIAENPADDTVANYTPAEFRVKPWGADYVLYWQASTDNGVTFVNINENSLYKNTTKDAVYITSATPSLSGMQFRCILKSTNPACGLLRDTSEAATLVVRDLLSVADNDKSGIEVSVYPNPVKGSELFVNTSGIPVNKIEMRVMDKLGRMVYNTPADLSTSKKLAIPVGSIAPGVYSLQILDADNRLISTSSFTKQ
jgi:hypothetical protein